MGLQAPSPSQCVAPSSFKSNDFSLTPPECTVLYHDWVCSSASILTQIPGTRGRPYPASDFLRLQYTLPNRTDTLLRLLYTMSQSPLATASSSNSNFESVFKTAIKTYKERTGQDLTSHPLFTRLKTCDSPDAILVVLRAQVQEFDQSRRNDERLTKWLNPTVNVLYAFSATLGEGVGLVSLGR